MDHGFGGGGCNGGDGGSKYDQMNRDQGSSSDTSSLVPVCLFQTINHHSPYQEQCEEKRMSQLQDVSLFVNELYGMTNITSLIVDDHCQKVIHPK